MAAANRGELMNWEEVLGMAAGCCTASCMVPELIKVIREKDASSLAFGMLVIILVGLGLWIWYGILRHDIPLIATNSFSFVLNAALLVLRFKYGEKKD